MNAWEEQFEEFKRDFTRELLDGPLEHVENLETIIEDGLTTSGLPGIFRLLMECEQDLKSEKRATEHWVQRASAGAPSGSECSSCGSHDKLLTPEVTCSKCFLDTFTKYHQATQE